MTMTMHPSTFRSGCWTGSGSLADEWPVYAGGTAVNVGGILDSGVRRAVCDWNDVLGGVDDVLATNTVSNDPFIRTFFDTTAFLHRSAMWIVSGPTRLEPASDSRALRDSASPVAEAGGGAVGVIEGLAEALGFPIDRILSAADINRRTYYTWRERVDAQPRLASQGRLWSLKQCIDDLTNLIETPNRWLMDPARIGLFEAGAFDELVELAVAQTRPTYTGDNGGGGFTGDDDLVVTARRGDRPPPVLRKAKRANRR
jgi:hypothetical protein